MENKYLFILTVWCIVIGCGPKQFETEEELWEYIKDPDNGYLQEKTVNGVHFSLLYKPTDLIVAQELGKKDATKEEVQSLRNKYSDYVYFNLSMSRGNQELLNSVAGDRNQFGAMVNTLAFGMESKIHLYSQKKDSIPLIDYVYPRMYGMSKNTSLLLVYPREEVDKYSQIHLSIVDLGFGTGEVNFKFTKTVFQQELKLSLR